MKSRAKENVPAKDHNSGGAFSINDMMEHFYFFSYWQKYLWGGIERWAGKGRNRDKRVKITQPEQDPYFVRFYGLERPWSKPLEDIPRSSVVSTDNGDE